MFIYSIQLLKSALLLCVARLRLMLASAMGFELNAGFVVLASNYGEKPDPNLHALIDFCLADSCSFYVVSNMKKINGVDFDRVVQRGSFKSVILFLSADSVFYTHSLSDAIPSGHKLGFLSGLLDFPRCIFIQHGIIGLKSKLTERTSLSDYLKSLESTFDFVCVSSEWERDVVASCGISQSKIDITGLPRFDFYKARQFRKSDGAIKILVAFTWQDTENYEAKCEEVLSAIEKCRGIGLNYEVSFERHPMLNWTGSRTDIANCGKGLVDKVMGSDLLITDDSSIAWDVLYCGGEVLFYKSAKNWFVDFDFLKQRQTFCVNDLVNRLQSFYRDRSIAEVPKFTLHEDECNSMRVLRLGQND